MLLMAHVNPSADRLRELLTQAKTIAVIGASSKTDRPSHGIMGKLLRAGYRVIPVNPNETAVLGERAYPTLRAVGENIDIVDVFRRAENTLPIAHDAVRIGAKVLWLQQDIWNEQAAAVARAGGLEVVMDSCIAVMWSLLQVPSKHDPGPPVR
jgi:predicted CoA-binding protein